MNWSIEFFCDIYAVCTLGPAFGWAHLYLCLKRGGNPFFVPTIGQVADHPNDEARAKVIALVLEKTGYKADANEIQSKWNEFTALTSYRKDDANKHAYPSELLELVAKACCNATCSIGFLGKSGKIAAVLNESWKKFLTSADDFLEWEKDIVQRIKSDTLPEIIQ